MRKYRFKKPHSNPEIADIQRQIEDQYSQYEKDVEIIPAHSKAKRGYFLKSDGRKAVWAEFTTIPGLPSIPGSIPASSHVSTHEDGGSDEIDLGGLSGIPTDMLNMSIAMSVALGMP